MYSAKRTNDRRADIKANFNLNEAAPLTLDKTLSLVSETKPSKDKRKLILKTIQLPNSSQQLVGSQDATLRKTYASSLYYFKPECYDFIGDSLYLCCKVQPLSLQSLLWIHRMQKMQISRQFLRQFIVKMYEGLARLKSTDVFPDNLKPTNLFLECKDEDKDWVWGEAGLHTNRRNQFYCKVNLQNLSKNNSVKIQFLQVEFYALGVMLLEMITLQPVQKLDRILRKRDDLYSLESYDEAERYYGRDVTTIIKYLLNPPKDSSLNKLMQQYKQGDKRDNEKESKGRREIEEEPDYSAYWLTPERLETYVEDKLLQRVETEAKRYVKQTNCSCREVFDKITILDPDFSFCLPGMKEFQSLLEELGVKLALDELLFVSTYYTANSALRYFKLIQRLFDPKQLIENIIAKAVESYDSFKDFFESQTDGKQFWKSDEVRSFLQKLEVPFEEKEVNEVVKGWTGSTRTSVKYDELYKVFKPILGMSLSLSTLKKPKSELAQPHGSALQKLIELLLDKQSDLIGFFRKHDLKQNWILDFKIQKTIRSYLKADEQLFKRAFIEMWEKGSIPGDMTKQINYVYLIRNLELYEPIELFRMILTQKINEAGREAFFEKYRKGEKGWTMHSFADFNRDQNLDFEERELKALFAELDTDRSGVIEQRELVYKLTGLKEFDYAMVVETISNALSKKGVNLFKDFKHYDSRARLVIGNLSELKNILERLDVEQSQDHTDQLFNKFSRNGKFEYLVFLREFYEVRELFVWAVQFILEQHYKGDFEKLFPMGLKEGRKKWNRQSLVLVNEELVLGFREVELGEVWGKLDPNQEGSLTKEQVATIFNFEVEKREELTRKPVESIRDLPKRKGDIEQDLKTSISKTVAGKEKETNREKAVIQEFREVGEKTLLNLPLRLLQQSQDGNGRIELQTCLNVLEKIGVQSKRADLMAVVSRFKELQGSKKASLNFILLVFYLFDEMFKDSEEKQRQTGRYKADVCVSLMKQIKRNRGLSNEEIFSWCRRKDRMRLSDFEEIFRKMVEVDVYFQDLQEIWQSWGEQDSFSLKEFDDLLRNHEFKENTGKDNQTDKHKLGDKYQQDRLEKADKYGKGKYDREDRGKTERNDRGEKYGKGEHDQAQKNGRGDRYDKADKYGKAEKDDRTEKYDRGGKYDKADRTDNDQKFKRGRFDRQAEKESDREDRLDRQKKGFKRLGHQNKMRDFVHDSEVDTPNLNKAISFGQPQNSRKGSIRDSETEHIDPHQKGTSRRSIKQTAKFGGQPKGRNTDRQRQPAKKSSFQKEHKQQKIDLEEQHVDPQKQKSRSKTKEEPTPKRSLGKASLLEKFRHETEELGNGYINELFSKTTLVESKKFVNCLCIHYNFQQEEASQLAETLATFGKIKLESLRKQLNKQSKKQKDKPSKSKEKQSRWEQDDKPVSPQRKSPARKNQEKQKTAGKKLVDPRRQKINVPLIREHIRLLLNTFGKRYQMAELQPFFFEDQDSVAREDFVRKCQSVDSSFKQTICERIFDYLKPDAQDRVGLLSFKLGTGMQDTTDHESDDFLPQQLQKQLKLIFQKADKDHSGTIEANELQSLMSSLGFNENIKQIENYFSRIDQNYDNKISYSEFRRFIEDQILPKLSNFDEEEEELEETLRNNDIFRHGSLPAQTLQAVLERYGVKLTSYDVQVLVRSLNPEGEEVRINQILMALRQPTLYPGKMKAILYKIRLRKKVQLKQIQKVFENISSCFVLAFTPNQMQRQILNISTPFKPQLHESGLFYSDLAVKDARKVGQEQGNLAGEILASDLLVEMMMKQITGVPIPQKTEIKNNIKRRYMNIAIFDLSAESMKQSVWQVDAEWDPEVEDVWTFSNTHKSVFVRIAGYQARKYEKYVLLFELVIDAVEGGKTLEINCGCATLPLRELLIPQGKTPKKLKLIAGLPNRAKQIDKTAVSKRGGWKTFFGGEITSEFELQLIHQSKFKDYHKMLAAMPAQCIVARRAVNYLWTYRQFLAECAFDGGNVNTFLQTDVRVLTFALSLDSPEVYLRVWPWWKQKVEPKAKSLAESKKILKTLLQQLYLILNAKQYELLRKCPVKPILHNTSLLSTRNKMLTDVLQNLEHWLTLGVSTPYKRKKTYNFNYGPLQLHEIGMPRQHRVFMQTLTRLSMK